MGIFNRAPKRRLTWESLALMLRRESDAIRAEFYERVMGQDKPEHLRLTHSQALTSWSRSPESRDAELLNNLADRFEGKR